MRKTPLLLSIFLLVMMIAVVPALAQPASTIKIGVLGPFTGPAASIGQEQLNWARLAVADFNAATGWSIELVEGDTELDPAKAVTAVEAMIADAEILAVVGPAGSQEVEATAPMFRDARLAHISGSATRPSLTQSGFDTFFRTVPTDDAQGPTDALYIYEVLHKSQLFIIDDQTSYAVGLADQVEEAFTAAGGTVVDRQSVTQDDVDFSALATSIGASGAEVVFFPGQLASQGALLAKQLIEQGIDVILFGADGFYSSDFVGEDAAGATNGAYVSSFAPDIKGLESSADVVARFTEQYGDFGTFGPPTYAATLVALEAIQRASASDNLTREGVLAEVANTNQELSVLGGPLAFDENGDVLDASFYIFQVVEGAFVLVPSAGDMEMEMTPEATAES